MFTFRPRSKIVTGYLFNETRISSSCKCVELYNGHLCLLCCFKIQRGQRPSRIIQVENSDNGQFRFRITTGCENTIASTMGKDISDRVTDTKMAVKDEPARWEREKEMEQAIISVKAMILADTVDPSKVCREGFESQQSNPGYFMVVYEKSHKDGFNIYAKEFLEAKIVFYIVKLDVNQISRENRECLNEIWVRRAKKND